MAKFDLVTDTSLHTKHRDKTTAPFDSTLKMGLETIFGGW